MAQTGSSDRIRGLIFAEKEVLDAAHSTQEAERVRDTYGLLKGELKAVGRSGDLQKIIEVEKILLVNERTVHANSSGMKNSLDLALKELHGAEIAIGLMQSPDTYRQIDEIHTMPKNRIGGVP